MRSHTTSLLLVAILLKQEQRGVNAFGVAQRKSLSSRRPSSSLHAVEAVEAVVEAITNGASAMGDLAPGDLLNINIDAAFSDPTTAFDAVKGLTEGLTTTSLALVGGVFGAGGLFVGSQATGALRNGELKKLKKEISKKESKIEGIGADLVAAESKQDQTKASKEEAIDNLERKIFLMDQEFEESTEVLKQEFLNRVKKETENRGDKIEQDMKFKYEIKMMRERGEMLQEKLRFVEQESSGSSLAKQEEMSLAKLEVVKAKAEIAVLENDLGKSEADKDELKNMIREGKNPFNAAGLKLKVSDMEKDLSSMEANLSDMQQQIDEANRELEETKFRKANPLYFVKEMFRSKTTEEVEA